MEFTLLIKDMNDYHFERLIKMPFLILQIIYHIYIIIIIYNYITQY